MATATRVVHVASLRGPEGPVGPAGPGWPRGVLANFTNADTLTGKANEGIWSIVGKTSAESMRGMPPELAAADLWPGTFHVIPNTEGTTTQEYRPYGGGNGYWVRSSANSASTVWLAWNMVLRRGDNPVIDIPDGTNLNALLTYMDGQVRTTGRVATILNTPGDKQPFFFMSRPMIAQNIVLQMLISFGNAGSFYYRITTSVSSGNFTPWRALWSPSGGSGGVDSGNAFQRDALVSDFRRRRAQVIGTNGLPFVGFRFDHGMDRFKADILALLRKYDLPWLQAVNSRMHTTATNASQNQTMSWADLQGFMINDGGEGANHTATHADAPTEGGQLDEVVNGLTEMQISLPRLLIESWAPPGHAAGEFGGAAPFRTMQEHYGTYAGRLVLQHHAAVFGYSPGAYRSMPQNLDIAAPHITLDNITSLSTVQNILNAVETGPSGCILMVHPSLVDSGAITLALLEQVFAEVAQRRDAGQLEVLSCTGTLLADYRTSHRHELLKNTGFTTGLTGWGATGWTIGADAGGDFVSDPTGTELSQAVSLYRKDYVLGASRELLVTLDAPAACDIRLSVVHSETGKLNVSKTYSVQPGAGRMIRKVMTLPVDLIDGTLTVTVTRLTGSPVKIRSVKLQAI